MPKKDLQDMKTGKSDSLDELEKQLAALKSNDEGQVGRSLNSLEQHEYDPAVIIQNWDLNNFNGYIICPLLGNGSRNTKSAENQVRNLYDNFSATHAVDKDKAAVAGASLGAQGTLYMANAMSDVFKKAAAFSPTRKI